MLIVASILSVFAFVYLLVAILRPEKFQGISPSRVEEVVRKHAGSTPWSPPLINVLDTNIALDSTFGSTEP